MYFRLSDAMYFHVTPKFFKAGFEPCDATSIVDVTIPELDIVLVGGKDIKTGRPLPNKGYEVVSLNKGRKAILGLLFKTDKSVDQFTVISRWKTVTERLGEVVSEHSAVYILQDRDYDLYTDRVQLWGDYETDDNQYTSRMNSFSLSGSPLEITPSMHRYKNSVRNDYVTDVTIPVSAEDRLLVIERKETMLMPSLEIGRFCEKGYDFSHNLPSLEDAIIC
ncbi:conserved hypothetical protein [Vibrio chagasii]|nr:conserved hypothetical protein [Vibrio chagasii]